MYLVVYPKETLKAWEFKMNALVLTRRSSRCRAARRSLPCSFAISYYSE